MIADYKARVNQKLYFARLHIELLQQEHAKHSHPRHVLDESIGESIVFHLVGAYRAYLQELAANYSVKAAGIDSLQALLLRFDEANLIAAELNELKVLEESESWLSSLMHSYSEVWGVKESGGAGQSSLNAGIALREVAPQEMVDLATTAQWYEDLLALIDRGREAMLEW